MKSIKIIGLFVIVLAIAMFFTSCAESKIPTDIHYHPVSGRNSHWN